VKRCLDVIGRSTGNLLFKILSYVLLGRTPARATAGGTFQFPDQTLLRAQSTRVSTDLVALGPSTHHSTPFSWLVVRSQRIGDSSEKVSPHSTRPEITLSERPAEVQPDTLNGKAGELAASQFLDALVPQRRLPLSPDRCSGDVRDDR